jgi:prevent-host-death family protein
MERVSSSNLKAKLGRYMRAVRSGREIVVTDRDEPVARLVPFRADRAQVRRVSTSKARDPAAPPLGEVEVASIRYRGPSTTALLLEDRKRR